MGILLTLILGGIAGYIASHITNREDQGIILNILTGIIGAFLANFVLAPLFGVEAVLDSITLAGFGMAVLGATLLLIIVNLITRQRVR